MSQMFNTMPTAEQEDDLFYGRWTAEEERYAEQLIKEFRDGALEDKDFEGGPTTLRGFLAHKLRCAPKRISKKYESSSYNGRQQFVRKDNDMTPEEKKSRREELESLEKAFETRRASLPKKVKKRAHKSRSAPPNSMAHDAAMVARDSASYVAEPSLFSLSLGGSALAAGRAAEHFLASRTAQFPSSLGVGGMGASTAFNEALLARANAFAAPSQKAALASSMLAGLPPPRDLTEAAMIRSYLAPGPSPSDLLAAQAVARRMDAAALYSAMQRESRSPLLLHEQILQRKRLQDALMGASADNAAALRNLSSLEGPPSKRPRAA